MQDSEQLYKVLLGISKQFGVPMKNILDFLYLLKEEESIENNLLLTKVGISKNALNQIKGELSSILMPVSKKTSLNSYGVKLVRDLFDVNYMQTKSMFGIFSDKNYLRLLQFAEANNKHHIKPNRKFDQFIATRDTVAKRVVLMDFLADIKNKKILFLGDDDLTSIAVASLKTAEEIVVLDIDKKVLEAIERMKSINNLKIKTIQYDAYNPLPKNLSKKFDVVFTDPPYTENGMELFLSRSIDALDSNNNSARIYICYGNSDRARERFLAIYEIFIKSGLFIRWIFDKFNKYLQGAESIGNTSSLYVCDVTEKTKSTINGSFRKNIYTFQRGD